jgi:ATP-binding cassette subfamily B protein
VGKLRRIVGLLRPYVGLAALSLATLLLLVLLDLAIPRLIQRIIDQGILRGDRGVVLHTAGLMLGISALSAVIAVGNNVFSVRVGEGVARDLRAALFLRIQTYSFGNLDRQKTGELLVRLTSDVSAIKTLVQMSFRIGTRAPLMMLGSLFLMVSTSPRLALTMLPLLLVTSLVIGFFVIRTEPLVLAVQGQLDRLNTVLQENVAGARLVKALVRADFEAERFAVTSEQMTLRSIEAAQFLSTMTPVLTMCINLGLVLVIWSGGGQAIEGALSLGQIVAFTNYMLSTMAPLIMMTMLSTMWAAGLASAGRVEEILTTTPDVQDAPGAVALPADARPRVALSGVGFSYQGEGKRWPSWGRRGPGNRPWSA